MPSQPEAPAPVTTPQAGTQQGRIERPVAQQPKPEPQPSEATALPRPSERTQEPVTSASAGTPITGEYNVQRNDTLWRIASGVTPGGTRREINRTMIALFRANPAAFNGNINRLRSGSVLRVPELTDIEAISTGEATAEVARQAAEWSGAQPTQTAQEEANRLRLVTPAETPAAPSPGTPAPEQVAKAPTTAPTTTGPTPQDNRVALPEPGPGRDSAERDRGTGRGADATRSHDSGADGAADRACGRDAAADRGCAAEAGFTSAGTHRADAVAVGSRQ